MQGEGVIATVKQRREGYIMSCSEIGDRLWHALIMYIDFVMQ
jgi:hypothetical protein